MNPISKISQKKKIALLVSAFVAVSISSVLIIRNESTKTDEIARAKLKENKSLIKPSYTPNSEKYPVNEVDGGLSEEVVRMVNKEEAKRVAREKRSLDAERYDEKTSQSNDWGGGVNLNKKDEPKSSEFKAGTLPVTNSTQQTISNNTHEKCLSVKSVEFIPLIKDKSRILGVSETAWWTIKNNTERAVSITLMQSRTPILLAYVPANTTASTKIPGSPLSLIIKHDSAECVIWSGVLGSTSTLPSPGSEGYRNAIFETVVNQNNRQIVHKTEFIGHGE